MLNSPRPPIANNLHFSILPPGVPVRAHPQFSDRVYWPDQCEGDQPVVVQEFWQLKTFYVNC